jgi:hypothetical protein
MQLTGEKTVRRVLSVLVLIGVSTAAIGEEEIWEHSSPFYRENCSKHHDEIDRRQYMSVEERLEWRANARIWTSFTWENDAFARGGDKHYTNGMKLSWLRNPCRGRLFVHDWLETLFRAVHGTDWDMKDYFSGGIFGMSIFTPTNLDRDFRQRDDRPYVGWLYTGFQVQVQKRPEELSRAGMTTDTLELQVGIVGPRSGQGMIQEWWHVDWGTSSHVPHWEFQVQDFIGINAVYTKNKNYWLDRARKTFRATVFGGGAFGNVMTFANIGAVLAIGRPGESVTTSSSIQPSNTNLALSHSVQQQQQMRAQGLLDGTRDEAITRRPWELALFAGVDHRFIWESVFVEGRGAARHDIELVPHVYDVFYGLTGRYGAHMFTYKHIRRSLEFRSSNSDVMTKHDIGKFMYEYRF